MPMSPRTLRPIASRSLVDADATAYLAAVEAADGQALEPAVRNAITAFVIGCKQDGIWSNIKASCLLMGARTLSGALTPLVGTAPTNNNFVSGDYNRKTGLLGNGSTKFLDSNRANNADPQDNQHLSVYVAEGTSTDGAYLGASTNATSGSSSLGIGIALLNHRSRHSNSVSTAFPNTTTGFFGMSRDASGSYSVLTNNSAATNSVTSQTPTSVNITAFVANGATAYTSGRIAFYSIGESLTLSLLGSRVSALYNAIGAAIP